MVPTLSPFERRTGVPSTLSLAINVAVSRLSTADCVAIVVLLLLQPHGVNAAANSRVPRARCDQLRRRRGGAEPVAFLRPRPTQAPIRTLSIADGEPLGGRDQAVPRRCRA